MTKLPGSGLSDRTVSRKTRERRAVRKGGVMRSWGRVGVGIALSAALLVPGSVVFAGTPYRGPLTGGVPTKPSDPDGFKSCANPRAGEPFEAAAAEEAGLDPATLQEAVDFHTQRFQAYLEIHRFGCLVETGNLNAVFARTPKHLWSVTKPVVTTALGRAITLGYDLSVDDPLSKFFPEADKAHGRITVRQLLNHTSGTHFNWSRQINGAQPDVVKEFLSLPIDHKPGTYFQYSAVTGSAVLTAVVQRAVGRDFQDFVQDELFGPLGIERCTWFWGRDRAGWSHGGYQLHMRPMDMARLGQLWLQGGVWSGRRLVSRSFMRAMVTGTEQNPAFGYQAWLNSAPRFVNIAMPDRHQHERSLIASAPRDMFYSWGWRGRHQFMMPNLGLMVVTTPIDHDFTYEPTDANTYFQDEQREGYHEFFRILMRAVKDQKVRDPGPWKEPAEQDVDGEQFAEPDQTIAGFNGVGTEHDGTVTNLTEYQCAAANPEAGPFVPMH